MRVLTIAGSDSGGGAGIQADMRTFALLGVHSLVAVTAVTIQNSLGVKGFHEIPTDVIAGQIKAVATDIGVQAAKTGMLASSAIIETVAGSWRDLGLAGTVPFVVDPVCASTVGDPLLHPRRWDNSAHRAVSAGQPGHTQPDEARLLVGIDGRCDPARRRQGCCTPGPVGPGQGWLPARRGSTVRPVVRRHRVPRVRRPTHRHTARPRAPAILARPPRALAHGYPMPDAVFFGKAWVTECLKSAYPLGGGHGLVSARCSGRRRDKPRSR